ncbi:hypothetical protein KCP75_11645 [Salmonella enterica subsp. enterica]|nr:hypothetical protein KCP75_11645 [Salmonella enterica subsp. enterica]
MAEYTLDKTAEMTGAEKINWNSWAQLYADPNKRVIFWLDDGFNQHTRGVGE